MKNNSEKIRDIKNNDRYHFKGKIYLPSPRTPWLLVNCNGRERLIHSPVPQGSYLTLIEDSDVPGTKLKFIYITLFKLRTTQQNRKYCYRSFTGKETKTERLNDSSKVRQPVIEDEDLGQSLTRIHYVPSGEKINCKVKW